MPSTTRSAVMSVRTSPQVKSQFAALAAQKNLTESSLLALIVEQVLGANLTIGVADPAPDMPPNDAGGDRLTVRLRPGDRALVEALAAARRMKTSTYLARLVRSHVRSAPVMPPAELEELRCLAGHLSAIGRELRLIEFSGSARDSPHAVQLLLSEVGQMVEGVRSAVADVVRSNLMGWEMGVDNTKPAPSKPVHTKPSQGRTAQRQRGKPGGRRAVAGVGHG